MREEANQSVVRQLKVIAAIGGHLERKQAGKESFFDKDIGAMWNTQDEVAVDFVKQVEAKFARKNKLHNYFREAADGEVLTLPSILQSFDGTGAGFSEFVNAVFNGLVDFANKRAGTSLSDAYVVVVHYQTQGDDQDRGRVLVVMLDRKSVFNFNDNYEPTNRDSIDIDALKQAASVDVTLFQSLFPNQDGDAYLEFITGNQSSDFFKSALECGDSISNVDSVKGIYKALEGFSDEYDFGVALYSKVEKHVREKLNEFADRKASVSIGYLQGWVDECLDEKHPARSSFGEYVNLSEHKVNEWTEPTPNSVDKASSFIIQDANKAYYCKVSKSTVGEYGSKKKVTVTKDKRHLMIPLSDAEREEILKRISDHDSSD